MNAAPVLRPVLTWVAVVLATLMLATAGLIAGADAGYLRPLVVRGFASALGRPVSVAGALQLHLFSLHPRVLAEGVTVGNPPWTPAGIALQADRVSMVLRLPGFWRRGGITAIDIEGARLHLIRDAAGRANWQWRDPAHKRVNRNSAILRSLSLPGARVVLDDARRHLQFIGTVSAGTRGAPGAVAPLRIEGSGHLNGRSASFAISADPLVTASHRVPYHFTFTERSGASRLDGSGVLPEPFLVTTADASFVATGPDLKDLYFLTGVHLIDTGAYRLSGRFERRGTLTTLSDLVASSGSSDMRGRVTTDSASGRPRFDVDLYSEVLKLSDLGPRAAQPASVPPSPLMLSDAMISPNVLHVAGALAKYHANRVELGQLAFEKVALDATIGNGVLTVARFTALVSGGRVTAHLSLDGGKSVPVANVDAGISDVQIGKLFKKDAAAPPVEGSMQAHIRIAGLGRSVHQVAASATGTLTAQLTDGALRKSFAELTDVDLRALGLLLVKDQQQAPVRCAIAKFNAQDGTLTVQDLLVDTDAVRINATGQIHLDSESLDLAIRATPKHLRLFRLRSPVLVQGTLAHPSIRIRVKNSHFVLAERGRAEDVDCTGNR